jgi:hypothetical protein
MMRIFSLPVLIVMLPVIACTQTKVRPLVPKSNTAFYKLGDGHIRIRTLQYGDSKQLFFINLHDDEETAVSGAARLLEIHGGTLVKIENDRNRNIRFQLNGRAYMFDPNRIFSRTGIIQTLRTFGPISNNAIKELEQFAERLTQLLPPSPTCVIALHNNSDGKFSVTSYLKGHEREKDAKAVHLAPKQDADDLFLTTDSSLFQYLRKEKFNAVWQDNSNAYKDGSLSIYCGEKNICYLNCETEHGKLKQYADMIATATKHLHKQQPIKELPKEGETAAIVYNYKLSPAPVSTSLKKDFDIYFGEKKIGLIKLPGDTLTGQMEIIKSFPLYDNMDFFFYAARNEDKIEMRIDPTRMRRLVDPAKSTVMIKVVP